MNAYARRQEIIRMLQDEPTLHVNALIDSFSVTPATIRRDLTYLERNGAIIRTRGEAHLAGAALVPPYQQRAALNHEKKLAIAKKAAQCVQDGDSIILDSGTTTLALAEQLRGVNDLTVITNSIPIASAFINTDTTVLVTGGILLSAQMSLIGPDAERTLRMIEAKKVFLGASGVRIPVGLTISSPLECPVKHLMLQAAQDVYALLDSEKLSATSVNIFAKFSELNHIITDQPISNRQLQKELDSLHIEVIIAR